MSAKRAARARELDRFGQLCRDIVNKARKLKAETDAYPAALDAALERLKADGIDLHGRITRILELTAETEQLAHDTHTLGQRLGEDVGPLAVPDEIQRIRDSFPESDIHRLRVFNASRHDPAEVAYELGDAVAAMLRGGPRGSA